MRGEQPDQVRAADRAGDDADGHRLGEREQVLGGYELYLLAARRPPLRAAALPWLALLEELARAQTDDDDHDGADRVAAAVALVDGWFVQHLVRGTTPVATDLARLLSLVLGAERLSRRSGTARRDGG